jgi:hypothetical protein
MRIIKMSKRDLIGTRLLKCPLCKKYVQYQPMYFRAQKIKALVSTCEHCDVRITARGVSHTTIKQEIALQDEYLLTHKEEKE